MEQQISTEIHSPAPTSARNRLPQGQRPHYVRNAALTDVLAYRNRDVVERYVADHDRSIEEASFLFDDVKRWLWLCAESGRETTLGEDVPPLNIIDSQLDLDEMWHTFILFTSDYTDFCQRYFGRYIHHKPTPQVEKRRLNALEGDQRLAAMQQHLAEVRKLAAYVFDKLGEDVARRWYLPSS